MQKLSRHILVRTAGAIGLWALGACADSNPVKDLAQAAGVGGEPRAAPDFVTRTRAANYDYLPVGESAPKPRSRAKDKAGVAKAESDLDSIRTRNEARGTGARSVGAAVKPVAPAVAPPAQ